MPPTTASSRRRGPWLGAALLAVLVLLGAACSSSGDDAAPPDTTSDPTSTSSGPDTSVTTSSTVTTDPVPTAPSTLPPSVDGTCAALAETIGLDEIQPRDSSSWVDERQRIVVDAQREAQLLGTAGQGAPAAIADQLATMQAYASWLATVVQGAADFSQAVTAIDAYPDSVAVSQAAAAVQTWRTANCP
jgi:hypothetical protein